jgi:hypothetical protein
MLVGNTGARMVEQVADLAFDVVARYACAIPGHRTVTTGRE